MKSAKAVEILLLVLLYGSVMALAQSMPQTGVVPGTKSNAGAGLGLESNADQQEYEGNVPASFTQGYFGSRAGYRNFFYTDLSVLEAATSGLASSGYVMQSQVSGDVDVRRLWRNAVFDAAYLGGGYFYTGGSGTNGTYQSLTLAQTFHRRRNSFLITNGFHYLPDLPLNSFGFGPIPSNSASDPSSAPPGVPEQGIVLSNSSSIDDTVGGTWLYTPNVRSAFSASGEYELMRFLDFGAFDSTTYSLSSEYDHTLGQPRDWVGIEYRGQLIRYQQTTPHLDIHTVLLEFKRNTGRRFAMRVALGPQFSMASGTANTFGIVTPTVEVGLSRIWRHSDVSAEYVKSVGQGWGLLVGSKSDLVEIIATRHFSRNWRVAVMADYARNSSRFPLPPLSYNSAIGRMMVGHRISRLMELYLQYDVQYQDASTGSSGNQLIQIAGLGLTVTPRAIAVR